jgi:hypothetical protein
MRNNKEGPIKFSPNYREELMKAAAARKLRQSKINSSFNQATKGNTVEMTGVDGSKETISSGNPNYAGAGFAAADYVNQQAQGAQGSDPSVAGEAVTGGIAGGGIGATGGPTGAAIGAGVGAAVGLASGVVKVNAARKAAARKAQADHQARLAQIEQDKAAKLNKAYSSMAANIGATLRSV